MALSEIIIEKIKNDGPIPFHDFMDMALYYPDLGYYTSARNKIGAEGDFYTSSCLTPVFGALIGKQIEEMWRLLGEGPFTIVEYGAGTGMLCHDILEYCKNIPRLYEQLNYCIIEKSPAMRQREKIHLNEKVCWHDSIKELGKVKGCILSNELLDNIPVHQVVMDGVLKEVFIDHDKNMLVETLRPAGEWLTTYLTELAVQLPDGFRTEINLGAVHWLEEIAGCLDEGFVITVDYGHESAELYRDCRRNGTLMCYHKHSVNDNVLDNPGTQDITSHVNFSALRLWGEKFGLQCCGLTTQAAFLLSLGLAEKLYASLHEEGKSIENLKKHAFLKHTLLFDMGQKFKVLIQQKGTQKKTLAGLRFTH